MLKCIKQFSACLQKRSTVPNWVQKSPEPSATGDSTADPSKPVEPSKAPEPSSVKDETDSTLGSFLSVTGPSSTGCAPLES